MIPHNLHSLDKEEIAVLRVLNSKQLSRDKEVEAIVPTEDWKLLDDWNKFQIP